MRFDDMQASVMDAKNTLGTADRFVSNMADMIVGRLQRANVPSWTLEKLKRELRNYNIHTRTWR